MKWTEEELRILKENYPKIGCATAKMLPGKTYSSVIGKAEVLGLRKDRHELSTEEYCRKYSSVMTIQQISKELNISYNEIKRYVEGVL